MKKTLYSIIIIITIARLGYAQNIEEYPCYKLEKENTTYLIAGNISVVSGDPSGVILTGGLKISDTNEWVDVWPSLNDSVYWNIESQPNEKYQVSILYQCDSPGAHVKIRVGNEVISIPTRKTRGMYDSYNNSWEI